MLSKKNNGITLVALVITIILLLIIAGVSISALTNTGIFEKANDAKKASENAEIEQGQKISEYEKELNKYIAQELTSNMIDKVLSTTENKVLKDSKGNIFTVPAGFKVTNDATTVDQGIVIEDATESETKGSQFVWIPVGTITKADGTETTITLGRYDFDETTGVASAYSGSYIEEDTNDPSTLKNIEGKSIAKNITNFINSVATNGGYYIGRYEARTTTARNDKGDALTQITEKGTDQVYNYVTQQQAAQQAQGMYTSNNFTSDLMNSYAGDTATLFLQSCGTNKKYSRQGRGENTSILQTGTNALNDINKIDKQCNVYDMAGNVFEWTTEMSDDSYSPCVRRGGYYDYDYGYTSYRDRNLTSHSDVYIGFRPILYL